MRLVVTRAAGVDHTVFVDGAEGIDGPPVALHAHHVGVAEDQYRLLLSGALDARDEVGARGVEGKEAAADAFALEDGLNGFGRLGFIAGRIAGIDFKERGEVGEDFRFEVMPVYGRAIFGGILGGSGGGEQETAGENPHRGILPCFLRGIVSTLFSSMRRARMTRGRVSWGSMTSST